jgi:hypothetical protein
LVRIALKRLLNILLGIVAAIEPMQDISARAASWPASKIEKTGR